MRKYSIMLPVYNGGNYLKECVKSILLQTVTDFTLHVVDSFSTDNSIEWVRSLKDDRVTVITADSRLTIEENWNRFLRMDLNEFLTIIGQDDLLHPEYLQRMDALIAKHPDATLYQAHFNYVDETGVFVRPCLPMDEIQYAHEFLACHFSRTMDSMGSGYMMRSKDYKAVGGIPPHYPNLIFADYELWIRLTHLAYKATDVKTTFSYRLHNSVSKTTDGMLYQNAFALYIDFIKTLMEKDDKVNEVVKRYGKDMLLYYCESLSHRLLKTPRDKRSLTVAEYIKRCETFAAEIIPGQEFRPLSKFRIRIAKDLDTSAAGRGVFNVFKMLTRF